MNRGRKSRRMVIIGWPLVTLSLVGGCRNCGSWGDPCAENPPGAVPAPVGIYNTTWQQTQESRADEDFLVVYQYEWLGDSDRLSPCGERHVERLLSRLSHSAVPIVVEASGNDQRDKLRIAAVTVRLAQHDAAWADYPVVVGRSQAEPLYGFESSRVTNGFIGRGIGGQGGAGAGIGGVGGGFGGDGAGNLGGGGLF